MSIGDAVHFIVTAVGFLAALFAATPKGWRLIKLGIGSIKKNVLNFELSKRIDNVEDKLLEHEKDKALHSRQRFSKLHPKTDPVHHE